MLTQTASSFIGMFGKAPIEPKSPQQQIFDTVMLGAMELSNEGHDFDVYDYLPMKDVKYPFVVVGEQSSVDRPNKSAIFGATSLTLHVYDTHKNRVVVSSIINNLQTAVRKIRKTEQFDVKVTGVNNRMVMDNSTTVPLIHGVVEFGISFN